jgi:NitT/TauT family transport system ATP-binding protein
MPTRRSRTQPATAVASAGAVPAVRTDGLTMRFSREVVALDDVSVEIPPGQFVTVVGPSGCGKSTLLRILAGLLRPTSGHVEVLGDPVDRPRPDVSMMFQVPTLLEWRTSLENVVLPYQVGGRRGRMKDADAEREGLELLRMLGLGGFEHHYPPHLSGGMQQRVALARLLITRASMLLLDEPFGALDEFTRERLNLELTDIFERLRPTVLLVTHNITEAVLLADRVMVMTPSPGRLAGVLEIDLPRPRDIELTRSPEFNEYVFEVRDLLGASIAPTRRSAQDRGEHR